MELQGAALLFMVFAAIILFFVFLYFVPINLWITALFSGVRVGLFELVFMRIRKVPPRVIVESLITATKAGLKLTSTDLETHYLAGGNVPNVIRALISAERPTFISILNKLRLSTWPDAMCLRQCRFLSIRK